MSSPRTLALVVTCAAALSCTQSKPAPAEAGTDPGGHDRDKPVAVDGGVCCPISESPACCMNYGGFQPKGAGCSYVCDGMPSPSEHWTRSTDGHACPVWVEPAEWENCCGCTAPHTRGPCDASGTWKIEFATSSSHACIESIGPLKVSISSDDDAGADSMIFPDQSEIRHDCGPNRPATQEESLMKSASGCTITLESHERYCSGPDFDCRDIKLEMRIIEGSRAPLQASVTGTIRKCWCPSASSWGFDAPITGLATRIGD
jgi:hypothetical protein